MGFANSCRPHEEVVIGRLDIAGRPHKKVIIERRLSWELRCSLNIARGPQNGFSRVVDVNLLFPVMVPANGSGGSHQEAAGAAGSRGPHQEIGIVPPCWPHKEGVGVRSGGPHQELCRLLPSWPHQKTTLVCPGKSP